MERQQNQPEQGKAPREISPGQGKTETLKCAQENLLASPHLSFPSCEREMTPLLSSLLHRSTARGGSLMFAKLLRNPLTEVAAQHEHKVVVFRVWGVCCWVFFQH